MTTFLLIVHGLSAVALLGAVTHQAIGVLLPARKVAGSFVGGDGRHHRLHRGSDCLLYS